MEKTVALAHNFLIFTVIFLIFLITQNSFVLGDNSTLPSSNAEEDISKVEEEIDRSFETDQKNSQHDKTSTISFGFSNDPSTNESKSAESRSVLNVVKFNETNRQNNKEHNLIGGEKDKDMNSIRGQESNIKYLEIYENSNKTSKPQGRTLSTIADAFLSANCFVKQCRKNRRRAEFCCVRNFNQACCDYLGQSFNNQPSNFNNQAWFRPSQSFGGSSSYPDYNSYYPDSYYPNYNYGYNYNNYGNHYNHHQSDYYGYDQGGWSGSYGSNYGNGYGWRDPPREKPGSCPPANHGVRWPNIGWGKRWKDKDLPGSKQEDYYLDEYDRIMDTGNLTPKESKISEEILKLGAWQSEENEESDSASTPREIYASIEVSREDLMEAKKDRLLLGFLKNKKPPSLRPNIWRSDCQNDYHCSGAKKCCLLQVAQYRYKETCRQPTTNYYNNYWK